MIKSTCTKDFQYHFEGKIIYKSLRQAYRDDYDKNISAIRRKQQGNQYIGFMYRCYFLRYNLMVFSAIGFALQFFVYHDPYLADLEGNFYTLQRADPIHAGNQLVNTFVVRYFFSSLTHRADFVLSCLQRNFICVFSDSSH